jgi:hypothetical protein
MSLWYILSWKYITYINRTKWTKYVFVLFELFTRIYFIFRTSSCPCPFDVFTLLLLFLVPYIYIISLKNISHDQQVLHIAAFYYLVRVDIPF